MGPERNGKTEESELFGQKWDQQYRYRFLERHGARLWQQFGTVTPPRAPVATPCAVPPNPYGSIRRESGQITAMDPAERLRHVGVEGLGAVNVCITFWSVENALIHLLKPTSVL
jgi:hypothetical protein